MSKTIYNAHRFVEQYPDPTAGEAIENMEREKRKKSINSRQKGAAGERELANILRRYGFECRRGQQYSGIGGEDVVGLPGIHIEVKRVERLNLEMAMEQSIRDTGDKIPIVAHRKNRKPWIVTMRLDDWLDFYKVWLKEKKD